jgi:hypothetical protein
MDKYPPHVENFFQNLEEINELASIHTRIAGNTPGRKSKVHILNKSAIVLLTACWEYYVEDLVKEAFTFLLDNAEEHNVFPYSVLAKASKELKNDKDERRVWSLAGNGWKKILEDYKKTTLIKEIDHFHVPRPENIDELYLKLLGINKITSYWTWKKMSNEDALKKLNKFVDLRGEIAHNVKTTNSIQKKDVDEYRKFLNCVAVILHNKVVHHTESLTKKRPWDTYRYGSVG